MYEYNRRLDRCATETAGYPRDRSPHLAENLAVGREVSFVPGRDALEALVRVEGLSYTYGTDTDSPIAALQNIDLSIGRGEYVAIVGHNGSGKSTLAKCLNGLLIPTQGNVWVEGKNTRDPKRWTSIRATVGVVFQNPDNQFVTTVVEDEVAFGPENLGIPPTELGRRVERALETTGLSALREQDSRNLSPGEKARLAIASVLAMKPACLVLDESTAFLDPASRQEILTVLQALHEQGLAIVAITHFMDETTEANRILVLEDGHIALQGTPRQVFSQAERLAALGLGLPTAAALTEALRARGANLPHDLLRADDLVKSLRPWIRERV